jgi:membrane-associated protease RseP (regulator of RpoE activity)
MTMTLSIRGWMFCLTLPTILAGSAGAQSGRDGVEAKVPINTQPKEAHVQWQTLFDASNDQLITNWSNPRQQGWRLVAQSANDDVGGDLTPVDASLRAQLSLPQGQGLVVTNVAPEGRAAKVGLKANDILLTLAGTSLAQPNDFLNVLKEKTTGAHGNDSIELAYLRGGKPATVKIKAEVRVSLAAAAEEKPDFYIGTPSTPLDDTFRAHLDIPAGTGLVVGEVAEGTPAVKAGVKYGDILLAFAGEPLPDVESLRAKIQATGPHPAKLQVLRAGKSMTLTITPEVRKPESTTFTTMTYFTPLQGASHERLVQGVPVLQDISTINRLYTTDLIQQKQNPDVLFVGSPQPAPADLTKKIDDLTAQVQALTKAVEGLKAAGEKK